MRLLTRVFPFVLAAMPGDAGFVQGVVLDHVSGRPLARTMVQLQPVPGSAVQRTQTMRTGVGGQFSFGAAPGLYLLTSTRDAYFPAAHGARKPTGRPMPIEIATNDSVVFTELRMRRKGGLTGFVFDENGVPMPGLPVVAYRARLPLRAAGTAVSDERGIYRVGGLDPGRYWVRTGAQLLNDGSAWLPTFGPGTRETSQAKLHTVGVDNDTSFADANPEPGQLFFLSGQIACEGLGPVALLLSSEAGQKRGGGVCGGGFRFDGLSPGVYELSGVSQDGSMAGFTEVFLDKDNQNGQVQLALLPTVAIEVARAGFAFNSTGNAQAAPLPTARLFARRQNLFNSEKEVEWKLPRVNAAPGFYEFRAEVPNGMYVESITVQPVPRARVARVERPAVAFDGYVVVRNISRIRIVVSDKAGRISGRVTTERLSTGESKPVPGAPVFLLGSAAANRSLGGPRQTIADNQGRYGFENLPPGEYRLVASFDVNDITDEIGEVRTLSRITVEPSAAATVELTLWSATAF